MEIKPIAYIYTDFKEKFGIPRQSGRAKSLVGRIVFEKEFSDEDAIRGIEDFSHLWLIFDFSEAHREKFSPTVRPPRLGGNKRVGVFASRSPFRPNSLGLSVVKLEKIEKSKQERITLIVSGIDILDNTPIYDIKPYLPYADAISDAKGGYGEDASGYRLELDFPYKLLKLIPEEKHEALKECLEDDPRPSYQKEENRIYCMLFSDFDISFKVKDNKLSVVEIKKRTD